MGKNLAEFRLLGIDVKVHWSFVLVLAFGAFLYGAGPAGWLVIAALAVTGALVWRLASARLAASQSWLRDDLRDDWRAS